ncbi:MAG: hypothetical protein U5M23_06280 [Marinagarivorans sp.]|nr:hypothetical protein [Marinagarivorans sp.]
MIVKHLSIQLLLVIFFCLSKQSIAIIHSIMQFFGVHYRDTHVNLGVLVYGGLVVVLPVAYYLYMEAIEKKSISKYFNFWFIRLEIFLLALLGIVLLYQ